ncbi:MAG TPA: hypothetical protein VIV06_04485 [Candidatus Limnocylindrales bacterium]
MTQVWRTLAIVYPAIDADWRDERRRRQRAIRAMSEAELAATEDVLARVPGAVRAWSSGNAALDPLDVRMASGPLRRISETGPNRWWAGPRDCRDELDRLAPAGRYDAVLVVWPAVPGLPLCGWGCTIGPGPDANRAGFPSIVSDGWQRYPVLPDPEEGFVHEWLHQVESAYRELGVREDVLPPLHDAFMSSCRPDSEPPFGGTYEEYHRRIETWRPWYEDWMTGRVRAADGRCVGLSPELWALRTGASR